MVLHWKSLKQPDSFWRALLIGVCAIGFMAGGCEGRAQKAAIRSKIGLTAEGHSLPDLENYYAVAVADKDHAWAVGTYGTILKITDDGSKVTLQPSGTHAALLSASAASPTDAVVGGENGLILRTTDGGAHWTRTKVPSAVSDDIEAFARGSDSNQIWAVGPGARSSIHPTAARLGRTRGSTRISP
jgi:photosystem II stability/assembly factor-like uncharacterized protein